MCPQMSESINLPNDADRNKVLANLKNVLINILEVKDIQIQKEDSVIRIKAKTNPSLLSWGEEIVITIHGDSVHINSSTESQIIDWGKTQENVEKITGKLRSEFGQESSVA